ncbi:hypothetical protein MKEN_01265400 [Mycena kentingensis (nom. inval.)]|nr:hypothetical protein MKEN_01265400 [Mycena kentingensis (nom. inval.)]
MFYDTIKFIGTVVTRHPVPDFPESDPDPIHHFSMRDRRSTKDLTSYIHPSQDLVLKQIPHCESNPHTTAFQTPPRTGDAHSCLGTSTLPENSCNSPLPDSCRACASKRPPTSRTSKTPQDREHSILVSELGELAVSKKRTSRNTRRNSFKLAFDAWAGGKSQPLAFPIPQRTKIPRKKSNLPRLSASSRQSREKQSKATTSSSLPSRIDKVDEGRRNDTTVSLNRFGWPISRPSPVVPPLASSAEKRPSFPPASTITSSSSRNSFPSLADIDTTFETLDMLTRRAGRVTNMNDQEDSRNLEHVNLSGSFVLQSTSCCDIRSYDTDEPPLPALVLTFPTPEPPTLSKFQAQPEFALSVTAPSGGGSVNLTVPTFPRCTHCGFGFGLDFHDLQVPYASKPCRFCEPQWMACKMWYDAPSPSSRPVPDGGSVAIEEEGRVAGVDEYGRLKGKAMEDVEGYSRFSNVIIKDKSRKRRTSTIWRRFSRLFGSHARVTRRESSVGRTRRWTGLDFRWAGRSMLRGS